MPLTLAKFAPDFKYRRDLLVHWSSNRETPTPVLALDRVMPDLLRPTSAPHGDPDI